MPVREVTWSAPGRVNLIGEHTDHNDGWVLPIALEQRTRATVRLRDDRAVTFRSTAGDDGSSYAEAVVAAFRAGGYDVPGVDISVASDVPVGAGLSSSAALECAIALAVDELAGLALARPDLVRIAQRAENDFVGAPTGILDQSASLLCTRGHALLLDCRDASSRQVPFDPAASGLCLLVVDTGVRHRHAESGYGERRRECAAAAATLGLPSLREATLADVERLRDSVLARRARHVVTEDQRVLDVVSRLEAGEMAAIGPLLTASHASLRDDFEVSVPELDLAVEAALDSGALGARMTGGGFGGSAIVLTPDPASAELAVTSAYHDAGLGRPGIIRVRPGDGARRE